MDTSGKRARDLDDEELAEEIRATEIRFVTLIIERTRRTEPGFSGIDITAESRDGGHGDDGD